MSGAAIATTFGLQLPADLLAAISDGSDPVEAYERKLAADRPGRRARGVYYTPPHLVDYTVEHALRRRLVGLSVEQLLSLRIIDPACGAGVFLVAALNALVAQLRGQVSPSELPDLVDRLASNCLYGVDLDATAVELCKLALVTAARAAGGGAVERLRLHSSVRLGNGLVDQLFAGESFDVVLGNPPWGQKGIVWTDSERAAVRASYRCGRGVLDPYSLFVERSIALLRPDGGTWGLVLPDVILLKNQRDVRDLVLEQCAIERIVDAGRAFPGVNLDAVIIVARRASEGERAGNRVHICHELPRAWRANPPEQRELLQSIFWQLDDHKFNIHLTPDSFALVQRLAGGPRLRDQFEPHEGVHTGNSRAKLFVGKRPPVGAKVIVGRDELARFAVQWQGMWLNQAPDAIDREAGDYANLGRPQWHERAKIVVRRTGDRVIAAYDGDGLYVSNNLFVLVPTTAMPAAELHAYVALLNSRVLTWYYRTVQPRTGRLFAELKIYHLRDFPLPSARGWERGRERLGALGRELEQQVRAGQPAVELIEELDELVCCLYELEPPDRALVWAGT